MLDTSSNYIDRIEKLFKDSRERNYPKNQLVQYEGDPLTHIYMIKRGYIKAYTILESGDTRTILILAPGDVFPLAFSATMNWQNYRVRYFYQALTETTLLALPSEEMRVSIEKDAESMMTYMNYMAASNDAIMRQLEVMKNKKAIDKVGLLLPYLISKVGKKVKPDVYQLQIKLSHQEIADLSGVTRETTTTLIKELEREGIIDQHKGKWLIYAKKLAKFAPSA